jgi:hypothetical protein
MAAGRADRPLEGLAQSHFRVVAALNFLIANLELEFPLTPSKSMEYEFLIANKRRFFAAIHSFFHRPRAVNSGPSVLNSTLSALNSTCSVLIG